MLQNRRTRAGRFRAILAAMALAPMALALCATAGTAGEAGAEWDQTLAQARGQMVHFNAWGGEPRINAYIEWAATRLQEQHGVSVRQVKLGATSEAVARILAETEGGIGEDGSVDLIWINGENFATLLQRGLLHGPWTGELPAMAYVDPAAMPAVASDFGIPVAGMEAPWGLAQLVFLHDQARLPEPPRSAAELLEWAAGDPGRFTYPQPPNFLGTTFLRQLLLDLAADPSALYQPVAAVDAERVAQPLWDYLDRLHPLLWRAGRAFPPNTGAARTLFADGEIELTLSFDPAEAANGIAAGTLPETSRVFTFRDGGIGNASFLAIPVNARHKAGAKALADFLLSPEAQARKQDPAVWGNMTILSLPLLPVAERARFDALAAAPGLPEAGALGPALEEPHPSWSAYLDREWQRRHGGG